jgi:hypothetical protein
VFRCNFLRLYPGFRFAGLWFGMLTASYAAPLLTFTDTRSDTGAFTFLSDIIVAVGSWNQTLDTMNTSVSAYITSLVGETPGNAYLTNAIGPRGAHGRTDSADRRCGRGAAGVLCGRRGLSAFIIH